MTFNAPKPQAIFPDLPRTAKIVDENNQLSPFWALFFDNLIMRLQAVLKNEGFVLPPLTQTVINSIEAIYTPLIGSPLPANIPDISGQTIFDATNRVPRVFIITFDGSTPPNIVTATWKTYVLI